MRRAAATVALAVVLAAGTGGCGKDVPLDPAVAAGVDPKTTLDPRVIFRVSGGCGLCHALARAGTTARTGPDLDLSLQGQTEAQIRDSILNPGAQTVPGYPAVMPKENGRSLTPAQLDALVAWLHTVGP